MSSPPVKLISECFIKPPKERDLSGDENQPVHFTPFELPFLNLNYSQKGLLFAKPPPENQDFSITTYLEELRRSLSATLTHFYPLTAGLATRKQENLPSYVIYIDPQNNPGVKFVYATVDVNISDILTSTYVPSVVHSFFDLNGVINHDGHTLPLLSIQVTELNDGIFIGGSINHLIADGTSFWHFMAAWSETFGSKDQIKRFFRRQPLQGYDPIINLPFTHHDQFIERIEYPECNSRFFHFSSATVSRLKAKANAECKTQRISSLQAVAALLWRCITRVRRQSGDSETICKLVINNRSRLNPPLSDDYFGNPIQSVSGTSTVEELMAHGLGWAALRIHEAVANHDNTVVEKLLECWVKKPVIYKLSELLLHNTNNVVHIGSSPRFDMYGCEFGLGKAVAARSGGANKADGKMTMYPGRNGGGSMEVEVCLLPEYMKDLEDDEEFVTALK